MAVEVYHYWPQACRYVCTPLVFLSAVDYIAGYLQNSLG